MQHRCSSWQMERYQNLNRFIESSRIYAHLENKNKNKPIKWRNKKEDVTSPPAWPPFALWILGEQRASWPLTSSPAPGVPEGGAAINQFSPSQQVQLWPWSPKFFHLNDTHTHTQAHPPQHTHNWTLRPEVHFDHSVTYSSLRLKFAKQAVFHQTSLVRPSFVRRLSLHLEPFWNQTTTAN